MKMIKHCMKPLAVSILLGISVPTFAANGSGDGLLAYISQVVNSTVNAVANFVYELNPDMPSTVATNLGQVSGTNTAKSSSSKLSLAQIKTDLTPETNSADLIKLASIPATDSLYVPSSVWSLSGKKDGADLSAGDNNFSLNSLISPTVYNDKSKTYASNYIKFLGNQAAPLSTLDLSQLSEKQRKELQANSDFQNYQVGLRALVSQQSVAYSNLYHLYAERVEQKDLGKKVGMVNSKGKAVDNASALQVEKYLATRRADSPGWYEKMSTASPTTLLREMTIELAEMEKQQYQQHMDNERILATLSTIELQSTLNSADTLYTSEQKIQSKVDTMTGQTGTSSDSDNTSG